MATWQPNSPSVVMYRGNGGEHVESAIRLPREASGAGAPLPAPNPLGKPWLALLQPGQGSFISPVPSPTPPPNSIKML